VRVCCDRFGWVQVDLRPTIPRDNIGLAWLVVVVIDYFLSLRNGCLYLNIQLLSRLTFHNKTIRVAVTSELFAWKRSATVTSEFRHV
jgi:hypothetical protein